MNIDYLDLSQNSKLDDQLTKVRSVNRGSIRLERTWQILQIRSDTLFAQEATTVWINTVLQQI